MKKKRPGGSVLAPGILLADLFFLFGSEVVFDVESAPDLLGGLSLDHVSDGLARHIEQSLDVQVVGCQYEFEEGALIDLEEFRVPAGDVVGALLFVVVVLGRRGILLVVLAPLNHLFENGGVDVLQGDSLGLILLRIHSQVLQHGVDGVGELDDILVDVENFAVGRLNLDSRLATRFRHYAAAAVRLCGRG